MILSRRNGKLKVDNQLRSMYNRTAKYINIIIVYFSHYFGSNWKKKEEIKHTLKMRGKYDS